MEFFIIFFGLVFVGIFIASIRNAGRGSLPQEGRPPVNDSDTAMQQHQAIHAQHLHIHQAAHEQHSTPTTRHTKRRSTPPRTPPVAAATPADITTIIDAGQRRLTRINGVSPKISRDVNIFVEE